MEYKIVDWTGKHLFSNKIFNDFEDTWEFIDSLEPQEEEYKELFAIPVEEEK